MSQLPIFPPDSQRIPDMDPVIAREMTLIAMGYPGFQPTTQEGLEYQQRIMKTTHTPVLRQKPNPSITLT